MATENKFWEDAAQKLHDCLNHTRFLDPTGPNLFGPEMSPDKLQDALKKYPGQSDAVQYFAQMSYRVFASVFFQWKHDVHEEERNSDHEKPNDKKQD